MEHGGKKTIVDATSAIGQFAICQPFVIHGQLLRAGTLLVARVFPRSAAGLGN